MKAYINDLIVQAITQISPNESGEVLGSSTFDISIPDASKGDYATNAAMVLFKKFNQPPAQSPQEFADLLVKIISELDHGDTFTNIEVANGFINFRLSDHVLVRSLQTILKEKENYGRSQLGANQKVLVEYFQPNMAKALHLGHLRTAIIGDSIFRILEFAGFDVASDTHLGDWGTQFGLLILAYKKWGDEKTVATDPINELNKLYVQINEAVENDEALREEGKQEFVKLEQGDEENVGLWKQFRDWSWEEYNVIYDELGVRKSDHDWPESFYADKMPAVIEALKEKGLLQESEGAQIVNLEDHNLGVAIIVKSDGGTTYLLRDLATYIYRKEQGFDQQLYVVDNRQSHTLAQTFKILELLGVIDSPDEANHIAYGYLSLPEGAMSTRKGTIISANELIERAKSKAKEIIEEKNPDLENKDEVAKQVMQAAIKYFDLSHNYKSDIVFEWDKALSFDGNTGPYLQYTHARIHGILRKADTQQFEIDSINEADRNLARKLSQLPELIEQVAQTYAPNLLCNYLFELAQEFNSFYEAVPVLSETDKNQLENRLALISATAQAIKNGLNLLGIEAPEQM